MEIQHFLHKKHRLKLIEKEEDESGIECSGCANKLAGRVYACDVCKFFLHEACANLPQQIQHFFHPHPLLLQSCKEFICNACGFHRVRVFSYRSQECYFFMDVECTQFQPISSEDEGKRILHFSHHHPLEFLHLGAEYSVGGDKSRIKCNGCAKKLAGQVYACEVCKFFLHEACANLPRQIQHFFHPHPLLLQLGERFICDVCDFESSRVFSYRCKGCEFDMDVECTQFQPISSVDEGKRILHFSHHHPLEFLQRGEEYRSCQICKGQLEDTGYGCKQCGMFLHKSCLAVLPPSIQTHPDSFSSLLKPAYRKNKRRCSTCNKRFSGFGFRRKVTEKCVGCALSIIIPDWSPSSLNIQHQFHPCSLSLKYLSRFTCNACFDKCSCHAYCCQQCDFYLGIECAKILDRNFEAKDDHIQHFCHRHPLEYLPDAAGFEPPCVICEKLCLGELYSCSHGDFHIHKSCLDVLPQKIDHHSNNTFILLTAPSNICEACDKQSSGLTYRSIEGSFKLCVQCILWPKNQFDGNGIFGSIHHWHPLAIIEKVYIDHAVCFLCGGFCLGVVYGCKMCGKFFHKSCAELPGEILHPSHTGHTLSLISRLALDSTRRSCSFCFKDFLPYPHYGGVYHCKECNVQLDMACATSVPSIEYQVHSHFLTLVEKTHGKEICQVCHKPCPGSDVLFCTECNFSLHLKCGPLPCTIKHTSHVHELVLKDFYDKDNETDEFPCHDCENRRDPNERVYICAEGCTMICELKCAAFEVTRALRGELGDVELRSVYPYIPCKVISKDVIAEKMKRARGKIAKAESAFSYTKMMLSLTKLEWKSKTIFFKIFRRYCPATVSESEEDEEPILYLDKKNRSTDEIMLSRNGWNHLSTKLKYPLSVEKFVGLFDRHEGSVPASKCPHYLPHTLIPIYEEFFCKYKILDNGHALDLRIESVLVFHLCAVLYDMRITKVVDITEEKLTQWLIVLDALEGEGFNVEFISTEIRQCIAKAHFVIQAKRRLDEMSNNLRGEVEQLSESIKELKAEVEAKMKKLELVDKQLRDHEAKKGAAMWEFREDYKRSLLIKWKPASEALYESENFMKAPKSRRYEREEFMEAMESVEHWFFKQEVKFAFIGLQKAGKTSIVNAIVTGGYSERYLPTVRFDTKNVAKWNTRIKLWDLGGQPRFRCLWKGCCREVSAIVYVVDAADYNNLSVSRSKLRNFLSQPSLNDKPLLVLGNKIDEPEALSECRFVEQMGLGSITDREVCCFMVSCKSSTNIDAVIGWLVGRAK